jgi:predicted XRE-type DNA-binding protein
MTTATIIDLKPLTATQSARRMRDLRAGLVVQLADHLARHQLTQGEMAKLLGITRPRLNRLLNKEAELFGIDALLAIAVRAGLTVHLQVTRPYRQ